MTRIIGLWMKNFKSFGKATQVYFSDKLTGIVGPNGSGKSNILDAICFVLGRTATVSAMRAKKGGELIFAGQQGAKAGEFAEVKLTLDNAGRTFGDIGEQVTISRRVRPDGLSAYRVNGKRSTRNQVLDLLAMAKIFPDGHNIVLQGDIVGIIRRNAEERRKIIDEIAGIEEYEEKKRKAELEFNAVAARIGEVDVLIAERMRHLEKLRKDRDKAARFKRLQELKGLLEASITKRKLEEREKNRQRLTDEATAKAAEAELAKGKASEAEGLVWKWRGELSGIDEKLSTAQSKEGIELARESERLNAVLGQKKERLAHVAGDIENIVRRQAELGRAIAESESSVASLKKRIGDEQAKHKAASAKREALESERTALMQQIAREDLQHSEVVRRMKELDAESSRLDSEKRSLLVEMDRAADAARRKQEELDGAESALSEIRLRSRQVLEEKSAIEKKIIAADELLKEKRELLTGLEGRLSLLSDEVEARKDELARLQAEASLLRAGTPVVIKKIMEAAKSGGISGVVCQVRDLLPMEGGNAAMLKAAAGDPNAIVVDSKEHALAIVDFLAAQNSGRVTIIFMGPGPQKSSELTAIAGPKDEKSRGVLDLVFGGKSAARNVREAVEKGNAATQDGTVVEGNRIVTAPKAGDLFLVSGQLSEVLSKKRELEKMVGGTKNEISRGTLEVQKLELEISGLKGADQKVFAELEEKTRTLTRERDSALGLKDARSKSLDGLSSKMESIDVQMAGLRQKHEEQNKPSSARTMERLGEFEARLSSVRKEEEGCRLSIQEISSRLSNLAEPELESTKKTEKQLVRDKEAAEKEKSRLELECAELEKMASATLNRVESMMSGMKELMFRKEKLTGDIGKYEVERYQLMGKLSSLENDMTSLKQRITEEDGEITYLSTQLGGAKKFLHGSAKRLQAKLQKIGLKMDKMGAVNLIALTEFDSAENEFREVEARKAKLESEKAAITDFMGEIEKKKNAAFMENFSTISGNFERVFGQLTGGKGSLLLENPERPLDGGLIIQASPKGKEVYRIESMSGGEQSLTALAFLFAIQEHKPAPFYVFDEVDAALDKDNSGKLAKLLSEYSKKSQLVSITHNDPIMRVCNQLVGVYLREGASHVVSATPEFLKKHLAAA